MNASEAVRLMFKGVAAEMEDKKNREVAPQLPEKMDQKDYLALLRFQHNKLSLIELSYFTAIQAGKDGNEAEKFREEAHQLLDVMFDTMNANAKEITKYLK
jgi:hypothetical protein